MNERSSGAGLGVMAAVALVACCALPALIGAGVLATVGGVLRNPLIILAGIVVLAGAVGYARQRQRCGQVCAPPTTEPLNERTGPAVTESSPTAESLIADLPPAAQPIRAALFAILRQGRPATLRDVSAATNRSPDEVAEVLAALRAIGVGLSDDSGRIVAADGLSLTPTPHQLVLEGIDLHTWCAIDAVVIPAVIAADAVAMTRCGHCHAVVELHFERGRLLDDPGAVVWFPIKSCTNVSAEFCPDANLFCDSTHLDAWRTTTGNPAGEMLTLSQAVDRCGFVWAALAEP